MLPHSPISLADTAVAGLMCVQGVCFFQLKKSVLVVWQQSKMEDRLEEAIHVLRSHAGLEGAQADMHSLLSSVHNGGLGGLSPAFPNASLALSNRHPAMVSRRFHPQTHAFLVLEPSP